MCTRIEIIVRIITRPPRRARGGMFPGRRSTKVYGERFVPAPRWTTLAAPPGAPPRGTPAPAGLLEPALGTAAALAQDATAPTVQEQRALTHARAHTDARLTQVLEALAPEERQALD